MKERLKELSGLVERGLADCREYAEKDLTRQGILTEAMWYSLTAGGKRLRPILTLEFCGLCGGDTENALPAACAIEMIHTFSLIHDDLPCMDNDDMRRGKPSCHAAYGEAAALLAGDGLLNFAYEVICRGKGSAETKVALITELSHAAGVSGMMGGQVIDTLWRGNITVEGLLEMYAMKTGALLRAACRMGCIAAGAGDDMLRAAGGYADNLGLAFQIIDDILDITGDETLLGKPVGSDSKSGKATYASLCGVQKSRETAKLFTQRAMAALDSFGNFGNTDFLRGLTEKMLVREY